MLTRTLNGRGGALKFRKNRAFVRMEIRKKTEGDVLVLELVGRLNSAVSAQLEKQIRMMARDKNQSVSGILLDCNQLSYISSAGLRAFLSGAKEVQKNRGHFALCNLSPSVQEVFEVSGFIDILNVRESRDQAIADFRASN